MSTPIFTPRDSCGYKSVTFMKHYGSLRGGLRSKYSFVLYTLYLPGILFCFLDCFTAEFRLTSQQLFTAFVHSLISAVFVHYPCL